MAASLSPNALLMKKARETLRPHWGLVIGTFLAYFIISFSASTINLVGNLVSLIVGGPLSVGIALFTLSLVRKEAAGFDQLFHGFARFFTAFLANLLLFLIVIAWAILLIIPGIMAGLRYSMVFYVLADNSDLTAVEALKRSRDLMQGNRKRLLHLFCRFIPWGLLGIATFGIGLLWVIPWISVTTTHFYLEILRKKKSTG